MGGIRRLSADVINQIAAGEVIERPASIVKELVENSLDAGATSLRIDIEEGGRKLVRVRDNGSGISAADLPLAFEPHATSKLHDAAELVRVATFGFRGEALASIAAVARVRVCTRTPGAPEGVELSVEGGRMGTVRPAATPEGTEMEIRNLFFATPARLKFLRNPQVEYEHIHETVARFAIAHPGVRFELTRDGESVFVLPPTENGKDRIAHFFGADLAAALLTVESDESPVRFRAWIAPPAFSKLTLKGQYLYLHGRFIRDRILSRAVNEAYHEVLPHGRYPVAFLFLESEPGEVDVNVHPTKIEVRFRHIWRVHDRLVERLRKPLLGPGIAPSARPTPRFDPPGEIYREVVEFFAPQGVADPAPARPLVATGRRFFQLHDRYIVEEAEDGIRIYDQHALHERVRLAALRKAYSNGDLPRQRLLMPAVVDLPPRQLDLVEEHADVLRSVGIEAERSGPGSYVVRSVPALLHDDDPASLLSDAAERLEEHADSERKQGHALALLEPALEFLACRSAVRFGNRLGPEEIARLLEEARDLDFSGTCAHGRPTAVRLTLDELERLFQRS